MARRHRRTRSESTLPGWAWMSFGLTIGLLVAGLVYLADDRDELPRAAMPAVAPAPAAPPARPRPAPETAPSAADAPRFEFYEMLPSYEVVVPEVESEPRPDTAPRAIAEPGSYVLQAGSFKAYADADARVAALALLGIEARIQRVTIDSAVFHRVRIGPIEELEELNRIRERLRDARVEVLLIRVP
jgi:cell division protein FtsN